MNPIVSSLLKSDSSVQSKIDELQNILRLVTNTLNLLSDMEIKGAYAHPVSEVLNWLEAMKKAMTAQVESFQSLLPKEEVQEAEVVK